MFEEESGAQQHGHGAWGEEEKEKGWAQPGSTMFKMAIFSTVWPVFIIAYNFTQLTSLDIEGNGTEQKMAGNIHYVLIPTSKS